MPEEVQNIFDDVVELKKANPWLVAFALTDNEVKEIIKLISRIILGSVKIGNFLSELKKIVRKDDEVTKEIAISALQNRLMPLADQIEGVEKLLASLGGQMEAKMPQLKTEQAIKSGSSLSFSSEDDEEIKQIISFPINLNKVHDYSSLAELIISESGYNLEGDEVIFARLKNMIIARLKDIRDEMETLEALKKSRKIGGMEMTDDQAYKIITLVKEKINQGLLAEVKEESPVNKTISFPAKKPFIKPKTTLEAIKNNISISKEEPVELKKVAEREVAKPVLSALPQIEEEDGLPVIKYPLGDDLMIKPKTVDFNQDKKISAVTQTIQTKPFPAIPSAPITPVKPVEPKPEAPRPTIAPQPQPLAQNAPPPPKSTRFGKPSVDGVRVAGMLVGPVEELGTMTLINFRRLGETPSRATAKIQEKINLLEKDSYGKKIQGIEAWHKSEVNRFYRLLGQESMRQERSIDDIINERIQGNKPTLSIEEFNAIMELNRQLRY